MIDLCLVVKTLLAPCDWLARAQSLANVCLLTLWLVPRKRCRVRTDFSREAGQACVFQATLSGALMSR